MRVWRISRRADTDKLSGVGGLYAPGRWHHLGYRILYTAAAPSLAALEMLVHYDIKQAPVDLSLLEIDVPDNIDIEDCDASKLTPNWKGFPYPTELQEFGSRWLDERRTAILSVPSVIIPIEKNYLINPEHPDASRIRIVDERPFAYDPRLLDT